MLQSWRLNFGLYSICILKPPALKLSCIGEHQVFGTPTHTIYSRPIQFLKHFGTMLSVAMQKNSKPLEYFRKRVGDTRNCLAWNKPFYSGLWLMLAECWAQCRNICCRTHRTGKPLVLPELCINVQSLPLLNTHSQSYQCGSDNWARWIRRSCGNAHPRTQITYLLTFRCSNWKQPDSESLYLSRFVS